jgi:hypothetical protein
VTEQTEIPLDHTASRRAAARAQAERDRLVTAILASPTRTVPGHGLDHRDVITRLAGRYRNPRTAGRRPVPTRATTSTTLATEPAGEGGGVHRVDAPAQILAISGRHLWWWEGAKVCGHRATILDAAYDPECLDPTLILDRARSHFCVCGHRISNDTLTTWAGYVLAANPSPHITDTWRILHATMT